MIDARGENLMANATKTAARSQRSHRKGRNFGRFIWNAQKKEEAKMNKIISEMIAEQFKKDKEKKENE